MTAAPISERRGEGTSSGSGTAGAPRAGVEVNRLDRAALLLGSRGRRRSLRELLPLLRATLRLVWVAGRRDALVTLAIQLFASLAVVVQVVLIKAVLDGVLLIEEAGSEATDILLPVVLLAVLSAVTSVAATITALRQRILSELVSREVWRRLLDVTAEIQLTTFEDPDFYDQVQRVRLSAAARTLSLSYGLVALVSGVLGAAAAVVAVAALAPPILPLVLLSGIPLLLASLRTGRLEFGFSLWQSPRYRQMSYLQNLLTGRDEAKEVRAFALAAALRKRWEQVSTIYIDALRAHARRRARVSLLGHGTAGLLTGATLVLVVVLVDGGRIDLASAGAALVAVRLLAGRLSETVTGVGQIFESSLFLDDLDDFLQRRPNPLAVSSRRPDVSDFTEIAADQVSFTYPGSAEPSLHEVSMRIRRGQVVALVGENGSGKTTLAKVLAGLYEPTTGAVRWDGNDVAGLDAAALRRRIAVIFQDFVRYKLSARDNVALGRPEHVDDERVAAASRHAGAATFLERLPEGYDTILSKEFVGGTDLSLGQWQRVALARAFIKDAPFVILDEPSSALDARAEHDLFSRIRTLFAGRTVLLISHRFSTVREADFIYVLRAGEIVECGDHDALMSQQGLYAELFELQARPYVVT